MKDILESLVGLLIFAVFVISIVFGITQFVDGLSARIDRTTCRDMNVTTININVENADKSYTAKNDFEELTFDGDVTLKVGDLITACDYVTVFGIADSKPYVFQKVTR